MKYTKVNLDNPFGIDDFQMNEDYRRLRHGMEISLHISNIINDNLNNCFIIGRTYNDCEIYKLKFPKYKHFENIISVQDISGKYIENYICVGISEGLANFLVKDCNTTIEKYIETFCSK